jgi:DNA-binding NarL/FixJ family response regulator
MLWETKLMAIKVMIVDDHPAVREGLAVRVASQPDMEICGQAADTAEAVKLLETVHPDVLVVDIQLENGNGLDLVERIKARDESIGILVWSMFPDAIYAQRSLHAGALGYINKRHATSRIVEAIRSVCEGRIYLCEETAQRLLGAAVGRGKHPAAAGVECLSDRELDVFRLIGQGLTTSQVAGRLHRSVNTIESHREKIKDKLGLKNAGELNRAAVQWTLDNG